MGGGAEPKSRPSRLAFHHRQCPHETETFVSKDSCLTEYYSGSAEERALFARRIEALIALYTLWSDLDEETTARLNTILLRMNKRTLQNLARLFDQPDDQEALSAMHRWLAAMHAEKVRLPKAVERESSPVEDMIDLRVMPTI